MNSHSYFWRHPDQLNDLQRQLSALPASDRALRVWSAGCAHGQEPYSVAALLGELGRDFQILATDICPSNIAIASEGILHSSGTKNFPERLKRFFEPVEKGFRLKPELLGKISFKVDDLRDSKVKESFDLIICRNVLIYFSPTESRDALELFRARLSETGLLVLGYAESTLSNVAEFSSTGRHATYRREAKVVQPTSAPRQESVVPRPLERAVKAFAAGRLEEAKKLFEETLAMRPVPQISYYFLTLLAVDLDDVGDIQNQIKQLRADLDFSDEVSRQTLAAHEISPKRFQKTLSRLFARYEGSV